MKKWLPLLTIIPVLWFLTGCAHKSDNRLSEAAQDSGPPVIQLAELEHDFGGLRDDGEYVHNFKVKNVGTGVLRIEKVLPD